MRILTHPSAKRSKRVTLSSLERSWAKAQKGAIRHSKSAEWYSWILDVLPCSGAFWTLFLIRSLYLDVFSSLVYDFFISFLNNSGFFKNNYLVDKYPKINLDKIQIIQNFIVIQSSLLFLCMQSYFKH